MIFQSLSSGSSGNCVYIATEKTAILVDAGFSGKQIEKLMRTSGLSPKDLDAIFITHEHGDHTQGCGVLSRRYDIPIYANQGTWQAMKKRIGRIAKKNTQIFQSDLFFDFKDLRVFPFSIHHDAQEPVGFSFENEEGKLAVLTDTGFVDDSMMDAIVDSNIYYIEANHDVDLLLEGPYPELLKQRILSEKGHLSNKQVANILLDLYRGGEYIFLAHMSIENNDESLCYDTVKDTLEAEGLLCQDQIQVAPRSQPSRLVQVLS